MTKPLILLVDDDRPVLDALEEALRRAFEPICRIEAFDRPDDVLAALPDWHAERRAIAVAIVDQKMPEMTGVALLSHLRSAAGQDATHPAAFMRAVLLTGYTELPSALDAKNVAGIARYWEKPWDSRGLTSTCGALLDDYLSESQRAIYHEFREVVTSAELRDHLRLRFEVYRETTGLHNVLPGTEHSLDADPYDSISRFFTLYRVEGGRAEPVGTLRVVATPGPAAGALAEIAIVDSRFAARVGAERTERFPLLTYLVDADQVRELVARLDAAGESVAEPGRFTLEPGSRRGGGRTSQTLAVFLIESAAAQFYFTLGFRHCLLTCIPSHARLYRPLGFQITEGTQVRLQPKLGVDLVCLHGVDDGITPHAGQRVAAMTARIQRAGATCVCPTFPECVSGPYATGRFEETDLFCPIEARATIAKTQDPRPKNQEPKTQDPRPKTQDPRPKTQD